jgi:hypothetical protein
MAATEVCNDKRPEAMVLDGVTARQLLDLMDKGETALVLIGAGS